MTPEQIAALVGVLAVAYGRDPSPEMFQVYEMALADVPAPDVERLAQRIVRTEKWMPTPAAIRERILEDLGYLSPDEDQAWVMAKEWSVGRTALRSEDLPQPVWEACQAVGGSWSIRTGVETTLHAQFREAYRRAKARADREAIERTHEPLLEVGHGRNDRGLPSPGEGPGDDRR